VGAHLVDEHVAGRYHFHDLLRAYAADMAVTTETDEDLRAATLRTIDHYLHTAYAACLLLGPIGRPPTLSDAESGVVVEELVRREQALDWFSTEHRVLLTAVEHAAAAGLDAHTWQMAWTLDWFLGRRGHWHDQIATNRAAAAAAARLGDLSAQARAHRYRARAHIRLGHHDEAHTYLQRGFELAEQTDDRVEQSFQWQYRSHLAQREGRLRDALADAERGWELIRDSDDEQGKAFTLNAVGWYHALLGDYRQALTWCEQALALFQQLGDLQGLGATLDSLGLVHRHLEHHAESVACYQRAIDLYRDRGDRYNEAVSLTYLGESHEAAGDLEGARAVWHAALAILEEFDHQAAAHVRARIDAVLPPSSPVPLP
jgi:tetratricopeptide (TPR) repeat protein